MINLCNVVIVSSWVGIFTGIISSVGIIIITCISVYLQWKQTNISSGINAWMPLKIDIFNTLKDFISVFYYSCTVPLSSVDFSNIDLKQCVCNLDLMVTKMFGVVTSLGAMNLNNENFLKDIKECCDKIEILEKKYKNCLDVLEEDIKKGIQNRKNCKQLRDNEQIKSIDDILTNETFLALYTLDMSNCTVDYLNQYVEVTKVIDRLDFKSFMSERNIF